MEIQVFTLKFDINRCYIIRSEEGTIMIDGDPPGKKKAFLKQLSKFNIDPGEIKLIILTHGDFDHIGSARDFREITGAKIAIHENDRPNLEEGIMYWPRGVTLWGKISMFILKPIITAIISVPLVKPDIILNDNEFALHDFGIEGKIIFTPGHSPGSVSIILENGDTFAGCMAQNGFPFTCKPNFPIYAFDIKILKKKLANFNRAWCKNNLPGAWQTFSCRSD